MRRTTRLTVLAVAVGSVMAVLAAAVVSRAATILVKPGKLDHFVITAPPTALAGESFVVRIEPYDASGNLITEFRGKGGLFAVSVSGGGEATPAKLRAEDFAGGAAVKVSSRRAGPLELSVTEGDGSTPLASVQARILPNRLDHFTVTAPRDVTAGEVFQARVIAQDAYGNTKDDLADIRESLQVEVQGTGTATAADKSTPSFRGGEAALAFQPRRAGTVKVLVSEARTRSAGESASIQVNPAALDHFTVIGPKAAVAGEKFIVLISAYDGFENPLTGYQVKGDGVVLNPSGTGTLAPAVVPAKEFSNGQARATLTYTKAEALRVSAREQNREAAGESDAIMIAPGDPDHFRVSTPAEAIAGEGFPAQLEALDRFGNLIEDYDVRGLEVLLSTDGKGQLAPAALSPAAFVRGKAAVNLQYNRAESFSVVAALSKDALEKLVADRKRQVSTPPGPAISPEDVAQERERAAAAKARDEATRAKDAAEKKRAKDEAVKAREDATRARDDAAKSGKAPVNGTKAPVKPAEKAAPAPEAKAPVKAPAPAAPEAKILAPEAKTPAKPVAAEEKTAPAPEVKAPVKAPAPAAPEAKAPAPEAKTPAKPIAAAEKAAPVPEVKAPVKAPVPAAPEAKAPAPRAAESGQPASPSLKVLEKVAVEEGKGQVIVRLVTSGPVSYNASTGSKLAKEWIWLELFPVRIDAGVSPSVTVKSGLVGDITVERIEAERARVSLQVLPPGISYVVTQQDRAVVVKVVRTE